MGANPNTMTFKTVFSTEYQMSHFKQPSYQILADTSLRSSLTKGQTLSRSYASDVVVNDMGADGSYSTQAITDTAETITIDKEKETSVYIKELDVLQAHLPLKKKYGKKLANALVNQIDADVLLAVYQGAGTSLDDGDFSGTAGNGLTPTQNNVATIFATASQKLRLKNTIYFNGRFNSSMKLEEMENMPVAVVSPEILTYIELYQGAKASNGGDTVTRNGHMFRFHGFELFMSNALPWTGTLAMATTPTDGDTVVINGVTFTFKATPASAGDIDIKASAALTMDELVASVNAPATTRSGDFIALSTADANKLKNITATDAGATATFVSSGWGTVPVSETFTDGSDEWTTTKQQLHIIFSLARQSASVVIQKKPNMKTNPVTGKIGLDHIAWTVYGVKVFQDQAPAIVSVALNSSAFTGSSTTIN